MGLEELSKALGGFGKLNSEIIKPIYPSMDYSKILPSEVEPIDWDGSIFGDIKEKIDEQNKLVSQEIDIIVQQNILLSNNYDKLKEMYEVQVQQNKEANSELVRQRRYNRWMMVIALIAMLAAIAGPIVTIVVSNIQLNM